MASHGAEETERLKLNVQEQLNRGSPLLAPNLRLPDPPLRAAAGLLTQLQDLEELRDEIDDDEYAEVRNDTLEQLKEFDAQLNRMAQGDLTLVSELGSIKLALEAAVREAFRTPEVIRLFARKEPTALRGRLARLGQEHRLGRLADAAFRSQAVEVIVALKRLGEEVRREVQGTSCVSAALPPAPPPPPTACS